MLDEVISIESRVRSISVCLPAYNEEGNIENAISKAREVLKDICDRYEIIVVDDGSIDNTGKIIEELAKTNTSLRVFHHESNQGYGSALKTGFYKAKCELVFFTDSDNQFDIAEISNLTPLIESADIVAGYRIKRNDPFLRLWNAKLFNLLIRLLFGLKVRDLNCAFKLFKRCILDEINLESTGALINTEFLIKAKKRGYKIVEVGVNHYPREVGEQTGANLKVIIRAFVELFKMWNILRR